MALLRNLLEGLRAVFGRDRESREMDEELTAFEDASARDKARAGISRQAALHAARVDMGSRESVKEGIRAAGWESHLESFAQDVRYAVRLFARNPGFTAVAVLTLALGIGANTAIFTLTDAVMLRFLPVQNPEELVQVGMRHPSWELERIAIYYTNPLWEQLRDRQDIFSSMFAWGNDEFDLAQGGPVQNVNGTWVSGSYFSTLGLKPAAGRLLSTADDQRGCPGAAVLSYGYWQSHYAGAPSAIGTTISLNRQSFPVIGVAPQGFFGMDVGQSFDVAIPICAAALYDAGSPEFANNPAIKSRLDHRSWWWLKVAGRVKPGVSPDQYNARLRVISPSIFTAVVPPTWAAQQQQNMLKRWFVATPGATGASQFRRQYSQPLYILMGVVAVVLLIACANLASLMLARAASRGKEIAVRRALGASRMRLVRQLLTECALLSTAGALLGLLFARWGAALLLRRLSLQQSPVFLDLSLDGRVLGFTVAAAVFTALLFGVLPALRATHVALAAAMKGSESTENQPAAKLGMGRAIVAAQVALSLVLLAASGLFLRSFQKLVALDLGFDRSNVLLVRAGMGTARLPAEKVQSTLEDLEARLRALPGVLSASRSMITPISGREWNNTIQADVPGAPHGEHALAYFNAVSPSYFETLRTPLLAGRKFDSHDVGSSPRVAIINQTLARNFFPGLDPVGRTFRVEGGDGQLRPPVEIVGVVKDAKYESLREDTYPTAYFPARQAGDFQADNIELRTALPPAELTAAVRDAVAGVNRDISLEFHTLERQVDDSLVQERLLAMLSAFFGALALLLAMIGLYGALSYAVTQRQKEFGVRMALGAAPRSILRLVVRDVAAVLAVGALAGVGLALASTRILQKLLFDLSAQDSLTLAGSVAVLTAVALVAAWLPARRATRVDPIIVLRAE